MFIASIHPSHPCAPLSPSPAPSLSASLPLSLSLSLSCFLFPPHLPRRGADDIILVKIKEWVGNRVTFPYRPGDTVQVHQDSRIGNGAAIPAGMGSVESIESMDSDDERLYILRVKMLIEHRTVLVCPAGVSFPPPPEPQPRPASVDDDGRSAKRQKTRDHAQGSLSRAKESVQEARVRELERQVEFLTGQVRKLEASCSSHHARAQKLQSEVEKLKAQLAEEKARRTKAEGQSRWRHSSFTRQEREVQKLQGRITEHEQREEEFLEALGCMELGARQTRQRYEERIRAIQTRVRQLCDQKKQETAHLRAARRVSEKQEQRVEKLEEQAAMLLAEHDRREEAMKDLETQLLGVHEDNAALEKQLRELSEAAGGELAHATRHVDLESLCRELLCEEELKSLGSIPSLGSLGKRSATVDDMGETRQKQLGRVGSLLVMKILRVVKAEAPDEAGVLQLIQRRKSIISLNHPAGESTVPSFRIRRSPCCP